MERDKGYFDGITKEIRDMTPKEIDREIEKVESEKIYLVQYDTVERLSNEIISQRKKRNISKI